MFSEVKTVIRRKFPSKIKNGPAKDLKFIAPYNFNYIEGSIEIYVQEAIKRHLKPGNVFFDIGANVGFFTILGANIVGTRGRAVAFEPVPANVTAIRKNIKINKFDNVVIINKAVSEHAGTEDIYITKNLAGATLTSLGISPHDAQSKIQVELVTIDELVCGKEIMPPQFVKIDVEGAEMNVLKGMLKTIEKYKPVILYEVDSGDLAELKQKLAELDNFMKTKGYKVEHLKNSYPDIKWHVAHALLFPPKRSENV